MRLVIIASSALLLLVVSSFSLPGDDGFRTGSSETGSELDDVQIRDLVARDVELAERSAANSEQLRGEILVRLAESGESPAIEYVRGVFESDVEIRDEAAFAISRFCLMHRRTPDDWRYLVRSLTVVEGDRAQSVLSALLRFRQRATKPTWIRQVILLGETLDADDRSIAAALLEHWSGVQPDPASTSADGMEQWRAWFRNEFPEEPDPSRSLPDDGAAWTVAELRQAVSNAVLTESNAEAGADVYVRAQCSRCHRSGSLGEQRAPELTRVHSRLQRKQILDAILTPSLHLNEEYPNATVLLKDGRVFTGTIIATSPTLMLLVTLEGTQHRFEKDDLEEIQPQAVSGMPSGLLDDLTIREINDLFAFLLGIGAR